MSSMEYPVLYVEGKNDLYVVCNLLKENGIELSRCDGPVVVESRDSVSQVLDVMDVAAKAAIGRGQPVGFILDADKDAHARWDSVCSRMASFKFRILKRDMKAGRIIKSIGKGRVGVWMMPYPNAKSGKLEDFLKELIPDGNKVLPIAQDYVKTVSSVVDEGERFKDIDVEKAEVAAWLSVQDPPGNPYGTAVAAHSFLPDKPLAKKFVAWFKELYSL